MNSLGLIQGYQVCVAIPTQKLTYWSIKSAPQPSLIAKSLQKSPDEVTNPFE